MIKTIDQITINGSNKIWNGYVYQFDYQPSFGQNPSYATVNLISKDGTYSFQESDLQVLTTHTIKIGNNITLQMYPVNAKFSKGPQGKTLEIRYIDTSIILDKKIVVLNGRQGGDGSVTRPLNQSPVTGADLSSFVYKNDKFKGSCYIPVGRQILKAGETVNQVLDVVYNFSELCDAIATDGIIINQDSFNLVINSNAYYFNNYIGSLRNVLANWCTDLGMGFYWEDNQLHFIDLTTPLVLNTSTFDNAAKESTTEEISIEDTVGRVACAFYGRDAFEETLDGSQNTAISFKCVTLAQVGLTPDQINSVKAAFYGKEFFFAYHFLLNSTYGDSVLGITEKLQDTINVFQSIDPGVATEIANHALPRYKTYFVVKQDDALKESNFLRFQELMKYVGVYYSKPIIYGDYADIDAWEYGNPEFKSNDIACSETMLGDFAAKLGAGAETLSGFLLGEPYIPPTDLLDQGSQNTGFIPTKKDPRDPYNTKEGFAILNAGQPAWFLGGVAVTTETISQIMQEDQTSKFFPELIATTPDRIIQLLNANYGGTVAIIQPQDIGYNNNSLLKCYGIKVNIGLGENFPIDIQTPEDLYPNRLIHVHIKNTVVDKFPKIEEFFRSEFDKDGKFVDCNSNVIKNELNFRQIDNMDLTALGRPLGKLFGAYGVPLSLPAAPSPANLDEAFILFSKNLTFSKTDPTVIRTYSLPYIDLPNNYTPLIGQGLMNLTIKMDGGGVNSTYTMGTRLMQVPSIEAVRMNLAFQRRTNQSRFLPYGYKLYGAFLS